MKENIAYIEKNKYRHEVRVHLQKVFIYSLVSDTQPKYKTCASNMTISGNPISWNRCNNHILVETKDKYFFC